MDKLLERLWSYVAFDQSVPMQIRLFRLTCLAISIICLLVIMPINAMQNLPLLVNVANILTGLLSLFCYQESSKGRDHVLIFFILLILLLDFVWFFNAGSMGSITYYLFPTMLYPMSLFRGKTRWIATAFVIFSASALLILEYLFPSLTTPFHDPTGLDRFLDLLSGVVASCVATALVAWVIITNYDRERDNISHIARELAVSEKNYREVVENAKSVILRLDCQGRVTFFNRFAEDLFGFQRNEILGKAAIGTITPITSVDGEDNHALMSEILRNPERRPQTESENICRDGRRIRVNWYHQPIYDDGKQLKEILCVGVDISERKIAEEKRLRLEQQTQHIQRLESLGLLAGGIAHDFNNLLTGILGNISLLKLNSRGDGESTDLLNEAQKASLQARDLTAQLLTFAKGGAPVKTSVSLYPLLRDCSSLALRGSAIKSAIHAPADLWAVDADAAQLNQVFNNLIINACQAMSASGLITVTAQNLAVTPGHELPVKEGRYVQVTVQDQGCGIADENLARIFDPYFTTKKDGTGLGLATVYSIVKNHRGHVSVQSKADIGTTFSLLLPAASHPPAAAPIPAVGKSESSNRPRRILVMDDEEFVRNLMSRTIKRLGHAVECSKDGESAIKSYQNALAQSIPFDVVIMDLTIVGGMGGKEAIRHLLQIDPEVIGVVSSGYSDNPVMANYKAHGFRAVLPKPYTIEQLKSVLQPLLDMPRSQNFDAFTTNQPKKDLV